MFKGLFGEEKLGFRALLDVSLPKRTELEEKLGFQKIGSSPRHGHVRLCELEDRENGHFGLPRRGCCSPR